MLKIDKLKTVLPTPIFAELSAVLTTRNITPIQLASFLAQVKHESADFTATKEGLNYSADRLLAIFPKYFTPELAKQYERKPDKIANRVYANRMGNGNEASGDGYKYSGRGFIQLTGKNNYIAFDATVLEDITNNPTLVATKFALTSAFWYFDINKLWVLAADPKLFPKLTLKINGGDIGAADRQKNFDSFIKLIA